MVRARDNPFSTDRVLRQRYRLTTSSFAALHAQLRRLSFRAAIVGPHGSGKTTLWEDLAAQLERDGWRVHLLRLSEERRRFDDKHDRSWAAGLGARDLVFLDGAEQLSWTHWQFFRRRVRHAGGLVITTHQPGRLPTLHHCTTSPSLLADLCAALGEPIAPGEADALYRDFGGNIREALRELYERTAARS